MATKKLLLKIYVSEFDKLEHTPLYESILIAARKNGIAGGTVYRGIMSYGPNSPIHSSKISDLSADLPIIIDIVDEPLKITEFINQHSELFDKIKSTGLIYYQEVHIY